MEPRNYCWPVYLLLEPIVPENQQQLHWNARDSSLSPSLTHSLTVVGWLLPWQTPRHFSGDMMMMGIWQLFVCLVIVSAGGGSVSEALTTRTWAASCLILQIKLGFVEQALCNKKSNAQTRSWGVVYHYCWKRIPNLHHVSLGWGFNIRIFTVPTRNCLRPGIHDRGRGMMMRIKIRIWSWTMSGVCLEQIKDKQTVKRE